MILYATFPDGSQQRIECEADELATVTGNIERLGGEVYSAEQGDKGRTMKYQASLIVHGKLVDDGCSAIFETREKAEVAGQELVDTYDPEHVKRHAECWRDYRIDEVDE